MGKFHGGRIPTAGAGRSWGCPAVEPEIACEAIDLVRDGSLLFVDAPDREWLARSPFLVAESKSAPTLASGLSAPD